MSELLTTPIDATSAERLAATGLRFGLLPDDEAAFRAWFAAMERGFNGGETSDDDLAVRRASFEWRRKVGVWDDGIQDAITPVGTSSSWITELTLPGERALPTWAVSTVTVAPTHRRRGIARAMLEAELRTAAALGVPSAILTASEATIYRRYGFGPAAMQADWTYSLPRASWGGPTPRGRTQLVDKDAMRTGAGPELLERVRLRTPGEIRFWEVHWDRMFGVRATNKGADHRVVRYDDDAGAPQGFAIYRVNENEHAHTAELEVRYLVAATDDASAGLWKYLLEVDLIDSVRATLRPIEESVQWQIADARAARKSNESDHLWTRILDVPASLGARTYGSATSLVLEVRDALDVASGRWRLDVHETGTAHVEPTTAHPDLALDVAELSSVWLGGPSFETLARAGRIEERSAGAIARADAAFHSHTTPWLSIWF